MIEDAELLHRYVLEKSDVAFTDLVRRHLGFVYQTALRQLHGDTHAAEDVAQLVFTDLARKAPSLLRRPLLAGWLHTSTRYAAIQRVRTESRRQRREQEAQLMEDLTRETDSAIDWERLRPVVDEALHALNAIDREAVLMRYFEGRDFAEVGTRLKLTARASRARVERAVVRMQTHLARRGVTSTVAALSLALTSQPVAGAPAGLAESIAGTALNSTSPLVGGTAIAIGTLGLMKASSLILAASIAANAGIAYILLNEPAAAAGSRSANWIDTSVFRSTRTQAVPQGEWLTDPEAIGRKLRADGFSDQVVVGAVNSAIRIRRRDEQREEIAAREARIRRWNPSPRDSIAVAPAVGLKRPLPPPDSDPVVEKQREQVLAGLGLDTSGKALDSIYRSIPADKARLIRKIEQDYQELRISDAAREASANYLLDEEFERDVLAVLTPEEGTSFLRYSSNAARQLQRALTGVDVPDDTYAILADAALNAERTVRTARLTGNSMAYDSLGLYRTYRRELGDDRFLTVTRNVSANGEFAPIDAIYETAGLMPATRIDRFLATLGFTAAIRVPGANRATEAAQTRTMLVAGLTAEQTAAFDASRFGTTLKNLISPSDTGAAAK